MNGPYLYCQNLICGVYLGSLGGSSCSICGWGGPKAAGEAYEMIDRFLRNNLDDLDYSEYSAALESVRTGG